MGSGTDAARTVSPEHAQAIDDMKDQLIIVLINRLGGKVSIPVSEVDDTGQCVLVMGIEGKTFDFEVRKKQ